MINKESPPIIFLDVDGVLNFYHQSEYDTINEGHYTLSKSRLDLFAKLIEQTNAQIVLSSTWRLYPTGKTFLRRQLYHRYDIQILDCTPDLKENYTTIFRIDEINKWLEYYENKNVKWVVLDDCCIGQDVPNFFKTSYLTGIMQEDVDSVVSYLKNR